MPSIALYYPWMRFQDDNWLKLALLTWDSIARIRPEGLDSSDSDLVKQVRTETDFIVDITPTGREREAVASAFGEVGLRSVFDPEDLRWTELCVERSERSTARWRADPGVIASAPEGSALVWVYAGGTDFNDGKLSPGLRRDFVELGLAVEEPDGGPWLGMLPKMASIYLATLADAVAQHNDLMPVTDDLRVHAAAGAMDRLAHMLLAGHARSQAVEDTESAYLHLALRTVIEPESLGHLPVAKLIAFRQRHSAELTTFRQHVADLGTELRRVAEVENLAVAQAHLQALYDNKTKPRLDELRRGLRGLGVESAAGTLGLKVDLGAATGTILGGIAAAGGQLVVGGAAVAVAALPYLAGKLRELGRLRRESPVAYLLAANRELSGPGLLRRLRGERRVRRA